jgi:hypothetical protein
VIFVLIVMGVIMAWMIDKIIFLSFWDKRHRKKIFDLEQHTETLEARFTEQINSDPNGPVL